MKTTFSRVSPALVLAALLCFSALGAAVYLQVSAGMAPCPLCILQRYVLLAIGGVCAAAAALGPQSRRRGAQLAVALSIAGTGLAGWLLWVRAHPGVTCGIDKLQVALNELPPAQWFPTLLRADGMCSDEWAPVFGVPVPVWSFLTFFLLLVGLLKLVAALRAQVVDRAITRAVVGSRNTNA